MHASEYPTYNDATAETEKQVNESISLEIKKQKKVISEAQVPFDDFYSQYRDQIPLDPLFKEHMECLLEESDKYTHKIEELQQTGKCDEDDIHSILNEISAAERASPEQFKILSDSIDKMQEETERIYAEEIPKLISKYEELARACQIKAAKRKMK